VVAYGLSLLTGTPVAYLRAIGRPSLEARLGAVLIACNVVLTVALGIAFGAYGVVAATTLAYCIGTGWFLRRFRSVVPREIDRLPRLVIIRAVLVASVAALLACGWGLAMVAVLPAGVALAGVALGAGAAAATYVAVAVGVKPTPAELRQLVLSGA
jgi:peptidoglycan biosynthesis protein MviN/MurJ (putative lipid II flippase)